MKKMSKNKRVFFKAGQLLRVRPAAYHFLTELCSPDDTKRVKLKDDVLVVLLYDEPQDNLWHYLKVLYEGEMMFTNPIYCEPVA
jgi:hypothetical protein